MKLIHWRDNEYIIYHEDGVRGHSANHTTNYNPVSYLKVDENLKRILDSPLFIEDWMTGIRYSILTPFYWSHVLGRLLYYCYYLLSKRFHLLWVEEGQLYQEGKWVSPKEWSRRQLHRSTERLNRRVKSKV